MCVLESDVINANSSYFKQSEQTVLCMVKFTLQLRQQQQQQRQRHSTTMTEYKRKNKCIYGKLLLPIYNVI